MTNKADVFFQSQLRKDLPEFRVGDKIKVWQKIKEGGKERLTPFEGVVIAKKHGAGVNATFTIRTSFQNIGVEKIFPLHSPTIAKIEPIAKHKVRRAKLYYLRYVKGKESSLKRIETKKK